ncbi:acetyltransferase [Lactococcus piscium]|uniref:acetyltransferase n=1 Tax=Pseudolactococcus carnosus TaxID=2749961 RepID=UPI0015DD2F57|nr:acetyltransferase [Lactococcus carnosus]MCJ1974383.1 acetyltransferase [Lactococcus carnosus]MCJ1984800.1 acetyltransferase [Lactococcus carnosus]MCJ1987322.1 acetyltransferase [Lactococcus carnosus]MCJ2000727.1 acetyltransferase [Lactococcus carnosus]MCJ2001730.1 acetyltransferase [Lactococcus carnosus]
MELRFYDASYQQEVEAYQLFDLSFTALPNTCLKVSQKRVDYRPILGIENDKIVCFFVLDSGNDKFKYSINSNSLLLRAFSTDSRETRKGYARQSLLLLPKFLETNYPTYDEIVLGVNEHNQVATYLYANLNFVDTKTRFLGKKGYQKIMSLKV